jgi:hypothetical protein
MIPGMPIDEAVFARRDAERGRLENSILLASFAWCIGDLILCRAWGPLGLIFIPPWLISLGILYVWHVLCRCVFRRLGQPRYIGKVIEVAPAVLMAILVGCVPLYELLPSSQFKRYVCETMPSSVSILEIGGDEGFLLEEKLIYFECAQQDFHTILSEYPYQRSTASSFHLDELAKRHLGMSLDELRPYEVYHADQLQEDEKEAGTSLDKVLAVNKEGTRAVFFHLYCN